MTTWTLHPQPRPQSSAPAASLQFDVESLAASIRHSRACAQAEARKSNQDDLERICSDVYENLEEQRLRSTCLGRCWLLVIRCLGKPEEFKSNMRFGEEERTLLLPITFNMNR